MSSNIDFDAPITGTSRDFEIVGTVPAANIGYFMINLDVENKIIPSRNRSFYKILSYDNSSSNTDQEINTSCTLVISPKLLGSDTVSIDRAMSFQCLKKSINIQYSSGTAVSLTSIIGGLAGLPALVGFGHSTQGLLNLGETINLSSYPPSVLSYAFKALSSGTVTTINSYFETTLSLDLLLTNVKVYSRLYQSTSSSNIFSYVPGSEVNLEPTLTGTIEIGTKLSKTQNVSIPVTAGSRLLMVYFITVTGVNLVNSVSGYANSDVLIETSN